VDVSTKNILVSITDFGQPFEPVEPPPPNPHATAEEREIGGLGLFFIHMSVDDIQYESSSTGNVTRLIKKL
jgi:anti-sigma regulatory factor (Ser/Thr protein kinase)